MHPSYYVTHTYITCIYRIIFRLRVLVKLLQLVCWSLSPKDQHFKCLSKTAPTPPELMSFSAQINKSSASFVLSVHKIFTKEISKMAPSKRLLLQDVDVERHLADPLRQWRLCQSRGLGIWSFNSSHTIPGLAHWPDVFQSSCSEQAPFSWRWGSCLAWGAFLPLAGKGAALGVDT